MKKLTSRILIIIFHLLFAGSVGAEPINKYEQDPLEYLYARHDDDRLVRLACAKALTGDAEGAFFLGAVFTDINSLYYKPKTGLLWLIIARKGGYKIADPFIKTSLPFFSTSDVEQHEKKADVCVSSNYVLCLSSDYTSHQKSLGWPPQTKFRCKQKYKGE